MIRLLTWGPRNGPQIPDARCAPAEPRRASITVAGDGGPRNGPQTPNARRAPAEPSRASIIVAGAGRPGPGPQAPNARRAPAEPSRASMSPPPLGAARETWGAPRYNPVASSRRTARSIARRGRPAVSARRTGSRSRTPWGSRSEGRLRLRTADSRADVTGCRMRSRCSCIHGTSRIVPASATAGAVQAPAQNGEGWRWWSAAFSNRAYCGRNTTLMVPVGPLRCLPMMTSAMFSSSGGTSSR